MFIFELVTAGGAGASAPPSWRQEGLAMLSALIEDFEHVENVHTFTIIEHTSGKSLGDFCRRIASDEEPDAFREIVERTDFTLVIAPECGGFLAERSRWVVDAGKRLLGSEPSAIDLAGDKLALARHFAKANIPTPPTILLKNGRKRGIDLSYPAVCKPRHGAGSQATFLIRSASELAFIAAQARHELPDDDFLLQPLVAGQPVSVTFIAGPNQTLALLAGGQHLSADGRFHYLGGRLPLSGRMAERAVDLGRRAVSDVAGLRGLVGVDLVLGPAEDGKRDWVIEINPRPTTSYVGLRRLAEDNLAEALLRIARGEVLGTIRWRLGSIQFSAAGTIKGL